MLDPIVAAFLLLAVAGAFSVFYLVCSALVELVIFILRRRDRA